MKIVPVRILLFAFLVFLACIPGLPAKAQIVLSQASANDGQQLLRLPFFEDDSGTDSVIQAQVQLNRFEQSKQLSPTNIIHFANAGSTYWINLKLTNNTNIKDWQIELPSEPDRNISSIKSLALYDVNQDKPLQVWPNNNLKPALAITIQPGETISRFILVKTWPGVQTSLTPVLKTIPQVMSDTLTMNREISLWWLIVGAVVGAGLVQLVLTRQPIQAVMALNGLLVGLCIYLLHRSNMFPQFADLHPVILPLALSGALGGFASIILLSVSFQQGNKAMAGLLPLLLNIVFVIAGIFYLDNFTDRIALENVPLLLLSGTGLMLMIITMILGIGDITLFWFMPAWLCLIAMPYLAGDLPFALPIAYVFFLTLAGIASVFGYWRGMDKETEALQRRLRSELRSSKEKYLEENANWTKKMENERLLLTELKQREQQRSKELEIAKKEADDANKAKSDFLAIISHEIRTPMNGIMGILQIIEQTPLNAKQNEYIEIIKNSGDTMLTLLNDILDYSKIENGVIDLESIAFSLRKLVQSVATLMHGRSENKGLRVIVDIDPSMPDIYISDVGRIRQILLNLVSNAIKFTERGSVTIKVSKQNETSTLFEIIDTGMGISEEAQGKLFQAYAQADASITRRFGGTGLGLNICRMLVSAMQGHIGLRSIEGKGSTFWFDLPLIVTDATSAETQKETLPEYKASKKLYILVIDDNEVNLKIVSSLLEMDGHEVIVSSSGEHALELVDQDRFDVIFVDMMMPHMDGKTFLEKLRKNPHPLRSNIPVFALTGLAGQEAIHEMLEIGMKDVLVKPVTKLALRHAVDKAISEPDASIKLPDIMANLENLSDLEKKELRAALKPAPKETAKDVVVLNMSMLSELKLSLPAETLTEIFSELIDKSKELTDELEKAFAASDYTSMGEQAHNIHGMAGNFGLQLLAEHSRGIEQAVRNNQHDKAASLAKDSRSVLDQSLEALDQWINS